jgi:hypothetical protein
MVPWDDEQVGHGRVGVGWETMAKRLNKSSGEVGRVTEGVTEVTTEYDNLIVCSRVIRDKGSEEISCCISVFPGIGRKLEALA